MEDYLNNEPDMEVVGVSFNGMKSLQLIQDLEPDTVILDFIMLHADGLTVLKKIRQAEDLKKPRIFMLTAFGQEDVMRQAVQLGAHYFILKLFDFDHLLMKIREIHAGEFSDKPFIDHPKPVKREIDLEANITDIMQIGRAHV